MAEITRNTTGNQSSKLERATNLLKKGLQIGGVAAGLTLGAEATTEPISIRDSFIAKTAHAAERLPTSVEKAQSDDQSTVAKKKIPTANSSQEEKDAFFDRVIAGATKANVLKKPEHFLLTNSNGHIVIDENTGKAKLDDAAYKRYTGELKTKAMQFPEPATFSRFLSGIFIAKNKGVITEAQAGKLIDHGDYIIADDIVSRIQGGLSKGNPISEITNYANEKIKELHPDPTVASTRI